MESIKFNYRPDVAVKAIDTMVEQNANDPECKPEQRKIFEDMRTLVHLGLSILSEEPLKTGPANPGNNKKS